MADMSNWDADAPGSSYAWCMSGKRHIPCRAGPQSEQFAESLKVYNNYLNEKTQHITRSHATDLLRALEHEVQVEKSSARRRLQLAVLMKRNAQKVHKIGATENLELALRNLMEEMGGPGVPRAYDV